ncbi:hypothetical protein [Sorangium sp. So ce1078]|uniref:hypothetical protein n=1 Tax=Sorangium sp. So ce1078 TaxID=3133329 RepID=UPI003F60CB3F
MRPIHNTMVTLMLVAMAQTVGCTAGAEAYDDGMTGEVALDEVDEALSSAQPGDETAANVDADDTSESRSGATPRNGDWGWDNGWDRHNSPCHRDDFFNHRSPCHRDDFFCKFPCHNDFFCKFPCHDDFFCKFPCHNDFFCKFPCSFNSCFPCFP